MILKYDLTLQKDYCVGCYNDEFYYESYDYPVEGYEFEIDDDRLVDLLASYESVEMTKEEIKEHLEELVKEYKWELKDDLEEEIMEKAQKDLDDGWL